MANAAALIRDLRKRVKALLDRAEQAPGKGALMIRSELPAFLLALDRRADLSPPVAMEVLVHLLEELEQALPRCGDHRRLGTEVVRDLAARVAVRVTDDLRAGGTGFDHPRIAARLFALWRRNSEGLFACLGDTLLELGASRIWEAALRRHLREALGELPLSFPPKRPDGEDAIAQSLYRERHGLDRMLGELLSRRGCDGYAALVARSHYERTGEALDFLRTLIRARKYEDALRVARETLDDPCASHRREVERIVDSLLIEKIPISGRKGRKELEGAFFARPTRAGYERIKAVLPPLQWPGHRKRILSHLHHHQLAPSLLFEIYIEEGDVLEADGLAFTQEVDPRTLQDCAGAVTATHPETAAGWLLLAAYRWVAGASPEGGERAVDVLSLAHRLCEAQGQGDAFRDALHGFRASHRHDGRLMTLLQRAGLGS